MLQLRQKNFLLSTFLLRKAMSLHTEHFHLSIRYQGRHGQHKQIWPRPHMTQEFLKTTSEVYGIGSQACQISLSLFQAIPSKSSRSQIIILLGFHFLYRAVKECVCIGFHTTANQKRFLRGFSVSRHVHGNNSNKTVHRTIHRSALSGEAKFD